MGLKLTNIKWILLLGLLLITFMSGCKTSNDSNQNLMIPTNITWNGTDYKGSNEVVSEVGKEIGTDSQGRKVFEDPTSPNHQKVVLIFNDVKQKYEIAKK